jgi:N-acyl-D-amino-acid deacylase
VSDPTLVGRSIADLARQRGQEPTAAMLDLIQQEAGAVTMVRFNQSEENVVKALRHPSVMVGSDSLALTAGPGPHPGRPHPRTYGTFPRVLGVYVREQGVLTWEQAVHKMTGLPAARLGLRDRGLLRPHAFADLAIIDPATVKDEATFSEPHRHPRGVPYVIVNGQPVIDRSVAPPTRAGRVLSRRNP